jgi:hypothetical protein
MKAKKKRKKKKEELRNYGSKGKPLKSPIRPNDYDTQGRVRGEARKRHEKVAKATRAQSEEARLKRVAAHMARCPGCIACNHLRAK